MRRVVASVVLIFILVGLISTWLIKGYNQSGGEVWKENVIEGNAEGKIVQMFLEGELSSNVGGEHPIISMLDQAKKDPEVKGIVIYVNSPGGDVVTSDVIYNKILEVKATGRRVLVSMGSIAASGGYYISAAADEIYANPATITGSLGVIVNIYNYQGIADKLGLKEENIKSGEYKDFANSMRELKDGERVIYQSIIDESYNRFIEVIAEGRQMDLQSVKQLADGRIYSGRQAKELGLIDKFGSIHNATGDLVKTLELREPKIVRYTKKEPLLSLGYSGGTSLSVETILESFFSMINEPDPRVLYRLH
ncbi:signal peptide peptidase SppA [Paenibacillus shunpengii]|uniref:Signal peptide peptidase SppA n=1 Tax=Paenibacillus shunpengii TaxID=2054424 RepID=A0ABW5SY00_9BACL|nr:signal peptide peptidase SppA [Paenibacillus sp. FSL H7-0326]